jgi:nucleotide-binding universal stress UspA family protein
MKNFIVPIDFSEDSLKGLEIAILMSSYQYTNIQMVYVMKKSGDYSASMEEEKKYAEHKFEHIVAEYTSKLKNDSILRYIIKSGKIYEEVVNQAHSYKDSMIAASTHGASGFEEFFIGSNAFKIITATRQPVITVRKNYVPKSIDRIILPINPVSESRQKVPFTAELARYFNAEIDAVSVCTGRDEKVTKRLKQYLNQVADYLKNHGIKYRTRELTGDNIAELVVKYANKENGDLISIITEKESGLSIFTGSFAHQVINRADVPVLNLSPKDLRIAGSFRTTGG